MSGAVMILAGGTGGHIFPGIAVARALLAQGVPVVWLGARGGLEQRLVPAAGLALHSLDVNALRGRGWRQRLAAPFMLMRSLLQALRIVHRQRPRSVISLGGYAAGPGGVAAWLLRRPLLVHEQNRVPGFTNRVLAKLARRVLCGFPDAFPAPAHAQFVGNPVRAEIAELPPPAQRFEQRGGPLRVLVLGGSQGARGLNLAIPETLARLPADQRPQVIHQCGPRLQEETTAKYRALQVEADIQPFIEHMEHAYADADLVICRAGALTIAELAAVGVGALLVPFPQAVDDHQTRNAAFLVEAGAAQLFPERADLGADLAAFVQGLGGSRTRLLQMAVAARAQARTDAAARVAEACLQEACA